MLAADIPTTFAARAGEWLFREGAPAWFYVLLEGRLPIVLDVHGKQTEFAEHEFKQGDFLGLGEVPLLMGTICTGRDLTTWKLDRHPFPLETSLPGVFAAGDVRHNSVKRVSSGVGEGSMAIAFIHQHLAV